MRSYMQIKDRSPRTWVRENLKIGQVLVISKSWSLFQISPWGNVYWASVLVFLPRIFRSVKLFVVIYSCAAGKRCLGTKKLSETLSHNCPLVVHSAVFKRKHQSVVQTTTDWLFHRNPIPSKDRYWCGCLIKHPHIYFTSAVVKLNSKQHGSFQNRAELIFCAIVMLAISVVLFLGSYGQTNGGLSFLLLSLPYIFHPRQRIVT